MKKILIIALALFLCSSCKKDKLIGENEIFKGKWNWVLTIRYHYGDFTPWQDTINSSSVSETYGMEFIEKGIMYWSKNNEQIERYRIVFNLWEKGVDGTGNILDFYEFSMSLKNEQDFFGYLNTDTLIASVLFPYDRVSGADNIFVANYFIRE